MREIRPRLVGGSDTLIKLMRRGQPLRWAFSRGGLRKQGLVIRTPKTAKRLRWNVLLVDVPDTLATQCEEILAPLVVVRVTGEQEALEQLPLVQPLVTCVLHDANVSRTTLLRERATDVGAVFVVIPEKCGRPELERLLRRALADAEGRIG